MMAKPPGSPVADGFAMFLDPDQIPIGILQPRKAGMP
jgi:hypothetical protein